MHLTSIADDTFPQVVGTRALLDKGRAFGNLGECYEQLGDFEESVRCHDQYLIIAQNTTSLTDQDKAYRGLGNAHRSLSTYTPCAIDLVTIHA
mgnify:CR=1 FL=1